MTAVLHSLEACQGKAELKAEFVQLRAKGLPYVRIARGSAWITPPTRRVCGAGLVPPAIDSLAPAQFGPPPLHLVQLVASARWGRRRRAELRRLVELLKPLHCSPRSCAASSACEDHPLRWPDGNHYEAAGAEGENHAPSSTNRAKAARIGPRAGVQWPFSPEIGRRTCPLVDWESAEGQGFGCRSRPSGVCRL